ncbi:hypothetical protein SLEP1_g23060 [Rubroshorea leprosula]|uniref:Uncharacterized protein n=1 Tax=Rubroshorea leprosula TaxID=152421 RepID=A0AAV5JGH0_9ROSI|nr:hypothetical protein SLEP1_g23060 [Rubroshorea leprosula]
MNRKRRSSPLCQVLVRWNPPVVILISIVGVVSIIVAVSVFVILVLPFQIQFSMFTGTSDATTWLLKSLALQSLIPAFLYSSPNSLSFDCILNTNPTFAAPTSAIAAALDGRAAASPSINTRSFVIPSPNEFRKKIEMYSPAFYTVCTFGGILNCSLIHMAIIPLDLVKCSMQV